MIAATRGRRDIAIGLFVIGIVASGWWLRHHMTDPLALAFLAAAHGFARPLRQYASAVAGPSRWVLLAALRRAQFVLKELPCPLCELQRVAFVMCGFRASCLNLRFGSQPAALRPDPAGPPCSGVTAAGPARGCCTSSPGTGELRPSALLGLHYYTWFAAPLRRG